MRRFEVSVNCHHPGDPVTEILTFPDDVTEEEIRAECQECLDHLIANEFDTGWQELEA